MVGCFFFFLLNQSWYNHSFVQMCLVNGTRPQVIMWPTGLLFHYRHRFFIALLLHLHKRFVISMFYFSFMHNSLKLRPPFLIDAFIIFKLLSLRRSIWGLMMSSSWWIPQLPPECWSFLVQLYLELFLSS